MTIGFITPLMIIGGAETYIINKCEWLITNDFNVIVISEGGENVSNLPQGTVHVKLEGISLPPLVFTNAQYDSFKQNLKTILLNNRIDVIEAHNSYPIVHVASVYKETKIPFCVNILSELSYRRNPLLKIITKKMDKFGLFYSLTPQMNEYIEGATKLKLNPNIIPIPVKAIPVDNSVSIQKYILSVSRLSEDKDYVKYLIQDFYELHRKNESFKEYKLVIVGDGNLFNELNQLALNINGEIDQEIIQLKGTVVGKDLETLYQECTMFVGMGTTLLLAASCAKPSIIAGFTPETNKTAWGFWGENNLDKEIIVINSPNDRSPVSFQFAIQSVIESDSRRISAGNAAIKMFNENYDYNAIMTLWKSEYDKIIEVCKKNETMIEKELKNYEWAIHFYRQVRRVVKFFKI
ncbi:Glycosyltransferase involved in cell wall bisynthesis [Flavobacterium sp. CF108]|nr:Glycosyltransferase involved in cell wall bisynthesis [Flavobacterium sp. fv08]SHH72612.1 Glycosyltransferase involved in cell wall bisynthesis [Flavobacterium sp. CF108]